MAVAVIEGIVYAVFGIASVLISVGDNRMAAPAGLLEADEDDLEEDDGARQAE